MKKLFLLFAIVALNANAQDVIVMKDGSTILAKVKEVNISDIKYKKFSNQNGPIYSINKTKVMAINYEGGDKDMFNDTEVDNKQDSEYATRLLDVKSIDRNRRLVQDFNNHSVIYKKDDKQKKADGIICLLGIKEGSTIETEEIKTSFAMKRAIGIHSGSGRLIGSKNYNLDEDHYDDGFACYKIVISLKNKTNRTIFIDLANTFFIYNDNSMPYYIPSATSTTTGNFQSGSVNLGAVTNALGVNGVLGTLANGINVAGGNSSHNTQVIYSQRIISIPPMSLFTLEPQTINGRLSYEDEYISIWKDYHTKYLVDKGYVLTKKDDYVYNFNRGDVIDIPNLSDERKIMGIYLTYGFDEAFSLTKTMDISFYLRQIIGCQYKSISRKINPNEIDYSTCPLLFVKRI